MEISIKIKNIIEQVKNTELDSIDLVLEFDKIESLEGLYPQKDLHKFIEDSIAMRVGLFPNDDFGKKILNMARA